MAKVNLSIYLVKKDITSFDDIVENAIVLQQYDENSIAYGELYY